MREPDIRIGHPGCHDFMNVLEKQRIQDKVDINQEKGIAPLELLKLLKDEMADLEGMRINITSRIDSGELSSDERAYYRRTRLGMDVQLLNLTEQIEYIEHKYCEGVK